MREIDWSRLRSVTARIMISALIRDGFRLRRQTGSHRRFHHRDGRRVTVSFHPCRHLPPKTLRSMIREQAGWSDDDLRRLKLLP